MKHYQVIIVGGGQAGLSVSYCLKKENINHLILDRGQIGDTWSKHRWDSFCLVTPNWQCRLPGFDYDGNDPKGFMLKDEIVDYIKRYVASFNPPIKNNVSVERIYKENQDVFNIETSIGSFTADKVVIATGAYHIPNVLPIAGKFPKSILQIHSDNYKNPGQCKDGAVLVIGTGQSGAQITEDLHFEGKKVFLAVGNAPRAPRTYRGKDAVEWLEDMGYYDQPIESHPDPEEARHKTNHYLTGRDGGRDIDLRKLASEGVVLRGQIAAINNDGVVGFNADLKYNLDEADKTYNRILKNIDDYIIANNIEAPKGIYYQPVWEPNDSNNQSIDLEKEGINTVIWCTGYKVDYKWIEFPSVFDQRGFPIYKRGVTDESGLYFIGLPWLHTWGSGRFSHVGIDAEYLSNQIVNELEEEVETCLNRKF